MTNDYTNCSNFLFEEVCPIRVKEMEFNYRSTYNTIIGTLMKNRVKTGKPSCDT